MENRKGNFNLTSIKLGKEFYRQDLSFYIDIITTENTIFLTQEKKSIS